LKILLAPLDSDRLQYRRVNPRRLGAYVDHQAPYGCRLGSHWIEDPATNVKKSDLSAIIARGIRARRSHAVRAVRWLEVLAEYAA
jgi:hypothetical protein